MCLQFGVRVCVSVQITEVSQITFFTCAQADSHTHTHTHTQQKHVSKL
jgi:hypothetical protein